MTTRIEMRAVSFSIGGRTILGPVSLDFVDGEHVAIVGPNGAGKTTLLRILAGELPATTGTVAIDGEAVAGMAGLELAVLRALLTHDGPVDIPLPAEIVVALARDPHRRSGRREGDAPIVTKVMEQVGISHLRRRIFATLSGGERSLVSLARVLAQETPVLLLDEPTGFLDVAFEERTMSLLGSIAHTGRVVITVGHDLNTVARHADRCLVISQGAVVADGPPRAALTADILSDVYGHPMRVIDHPTRDGPLIVVA